MSMFEKRVEAARRAFEDHQWNPTTRLCTCGEFFEASLAGHELRDAHRMGEMISAADAVVTEEQIAEALAEHVLGEANGGTASWAWINCSCRHRIEIAGVTRERVLALGRRHQAEVLTALFRGGAK